MHSPFVVVGATVVLRGPGCRADGASPCRVRGADAGVVQVELVPSMPDRDRRRPDGAQRRGASRYAP